MSPAVEEAVALPPHLSDLFERSGRNPSASINFVSAHDGFTVQDVVSYEQRHNHANGEDNRDGSNDNDSWNCGWEGDVKVPTEIKELRQQQAKNFCCLLMLSNGTPMYRRLPTRKEWVHEERFLGKPGSFKPLSWGNRGHERLAEERLRDALRDVERQRTYAKAG